MENFSLSIWQKIILAGLSFFLAAFGQPIWSEWLGLITACIGFACFWRVLLTIPSPKKRFWMSFGWYGAVQIVQLSWFLSHPYFYIYGVLLFCAALMGFQWGLLAIWIRPQTFNRFSSLFALAGFWTLLEWSRLFILSGLPFNPVGLYFSGSIYSLQFASIGGVYGLSFLVILINLLFLRAWIHSKNYFIVFFVALLPFGFGWVHLQTHQQQKPETFSAVLVQSGLPIEENMNFQSAEEVRKFVLEEWRKVLLTLQKQVGQKIDLIVFPEYLVPYGTFHPIFHFGEVQKLFEEVFHLGTVSKKSPYLHFYQTEDGPVGYVSNAYLAQTVANFFQAHVVIGLEDSDKNKGESYSAAFHFTPDEIMPPNRYEKQVLLPMGEYIPFEWCRKIAAKYGISGSFTCGKGAKVFNGPIPFGASICYEELFGHLMRENRVQGAELLVNLTNDGWYPNSQLPKQHFDHARLRTVENGIPLIRACNTGITGAIDSLGQIVGVLGEDPMQVQEVADAIRLDVPRYHYRTLYSYLGDWSILGLSCLALLIGVWRNRQ